MTDPVEPEHTVHIAGPDLRSGDMVRQLCAWCGAVLISVDLTTVQVTVPPVEPVELTTGDTLPGGGMILEGTVLVQPPSPEGVDGYATWEPLALIALAEGGGASWALAKGSPMPLNACLYDNAGDAHAMIEEML